MRAHFAFPLGREQKRPNRDSDSPLLRMLRQYSPVVTSPTGTAAEVAHLESEPALYSAKQPIGNDLPELNAMNGTRGLCSMKRAIVGVIVVTTIAASVALISHFVKSDDFYNVITWLKEHKVAGSTIFTSTFTLSIILCFPSTLFEVLAGYMFGFWLGLILTTVGKLSGSLISFFIGRYACRDRVAAYLTQGHPVLKALQHAVRRRQILVVCLTRVAFFPIAIKNYGLSVLDVSFFVFFFAALVTGLVYSSIWVYSGHAAQHLTVLLSEGGRDHTTEIVVLMVGAVSALSLLAVMGYLTRQHLLKLAEEEQKEEKAEEEEEDTDSVTTTNAEAKDDLV